MMMKIFFPRKIMRGRFTSFILIFIFLFAAADFGQKIPVNKYGLKVVAGVALYQEQVAKDSSKKLIDLKKFIPGIFIDVRYASKNNFAKTKFYESQKAFLRLPAAIALKKIQKELSQQNISLKIYDAYRPYSVTEKMWEFVHDDRYAASPTKGSRHNRACAVDVTLVDKKTKKELDMPTPYDDFTVKAHHSYRNLSKKVLKNRELLRSIMTKYGFESITSEWWHYDFVGWKNYELLDIPFENLKKGNDK